MAKQSLLSRLEVESDIRKTNQVDTVYPDHQDDDSYVYEYKDPDPVSISKKQSGEVSSSYEKIFRWLYLLAIILVIVIVYGGLKMRGII